MFAFACVTSDDDLFRACAAPAIQSVIEGTSLLMRRHAVDSLAAACNEMLDQAAGYDDLEGLVLVEEGTSLEPGSFLSVARTVLGEDPDAAVLGGTLAREAPGLVASKQESLPSRGVEVDAVGGALTILSPWAVRELRFDPSFDRSLDGCAADICLQARAQGRHVLAAQLGVRPRPPAGGGDAKSWEPAAEALLRKWRR